MILITGGTGFIGGYLVEKLSVSGEPVRCLVRPRKVMPQFPAGVETARGDLTSGDGVEEALRGVTTVIHLAGVTKALASADYYTGNAGATTTLARALAGRGIRFVHVSSLAAAGPGADGAPATEDAAPKPVSHYGKSKWEAEQAVRALAPDAVIVRPAVVYGPRDKDVFQVLKAISRGLMTRMAGEERWFSAIYVEDLADGLLAAARNPQAAGRTYFLAHPKPVSWSEFHKAAARIMGRDPLVVPVPAALALTVGYAAEVWSRITGKPGIVSRDKVVEAQCRWWTCDTRRAAAELGFEAPTPLDAGLARTLAWYKEAGWLKY